VTYRVSNVEAFRQWEADDEGDLDKLMERISGTSEASPLMLAGTAFHKALELAGDGEVVSLKALGHEFRFTCDCDVELAPVRELRASKTYMVDGQPIVISGQVDQLDGMRIDDHKTTGRFDPERYIEGCQWRLYLDIFGARHFRWNVFEIKAADPREDGTEVFEVFNAHRLEQFRYPNLEADCQALVERFARFVRQQVEA
jgi:hypothetical protein